MSTQTLPIPRNYVYFAYAVGTDRIKIGQSVNPEKRMDELQIACPYKLLLDLVIELPTRYEGILHEIFDKYRLHGEWFKMEGDLLDFISNAKQKREVWVKEYCRQHSEYNENVDKTGRFMVKIAEMMQEGTSKEEISKELGLTHGYISILCKRIKEIQEKVEENKRRKRLDGENNAE